MKKLALAFGLLAACGGFLACAKSVASPPKKQIVFSLPPLVPYVWTIFPHIPIPKQNLAGPATNPDGTLKAVPMRVMLVRSSSADCGSHCAEWIAAEGDIGKTTPSLFKAIFKTTRNRKLPVFVSSRGGSVNDATAIGHMIRDRGLDVVVSQTIEISCDPADKHCRDGTPTAIIGRPHSDKAFCASACVNILAAGTRRIVPPRAWVGLHEGTSIYHYVEPKGFDDPGPGKLSVMVFSGKPIPSWEEPTTDKEYKTFAAYYKDMGIKGDIISLMHLASNLNMHWVNARELDDTGLATERLSSEALVEAIDHPTNTPAAAATTPSPAPPASTMTVTNAAPTLAQAVQAASPSAPAIATAATPPEPLSVLPVQTQAAHIPAGSLPSLQAPADDQATPFATPAAGVITTPPSAPDRNSRPPAVPSPAPPEKLAAVTPVTRPNPAPAAPKTAAKAPSQEQPAKKPAVACGSAIRTVPQSGRRYTGEVRVVMSPAAGSMVLQKAEETIHVQANPKYFGYDRLGIWVYSDGIPEPGTAVAPRGMKAQPGDTVTIVTRHQDSAMPCHFVPNLVVAVKHK